jgi:transposase InsO family protein
VNVYPFIEAEKQSSRAGRDGNVARACELLKVSRSAYYAHTGAQAAGGTRRQREDADLTERIRHHHQASKGRNGAPRIHADLADEGRRHGRKRVARLMREHGIVGKHRRRGRRNTIPDPAAPARGDLIGRLHRRPERDQHPLVRGHYLHPHLARLALPGHRHRHRLPAGGRLGQRGPSAHRPGRKRPAAGRDPATPTGRGDLPLRPRLSARVQPVVATPLLIGRIASTH